MASLTTVYLISLVLSSLSAVGSTIMGNRFFPLTQTPIPETPSPAESPQNIEQTEPPVSEEVSPPAE